MRRNSAGRGQVAKNRSRSWARWSGESRFNRLVSGVIDGASGGSAMQVAARPMSNSNVPFSRKPI